MNPIQLFDAASSTYTYLLFDSISRQAVIIDPVDTQLERDLLQLKQLGLKLMYVLETHVHADHITSAAAIIEHTGAQSATPQACQVLSSAIQLKDGDQLAFGAESIKALATPGHTAGSMSFVWRSNVFTGDALLIGGCGRTDFQSGSAAALYDSITQVLFNLAPETIMWPGHDYHEKTHSSIGAEKLANPRLNTPTGFRSKEQFVTLMNELNLPTPKRMGEAVPANLKLGVRHLAEPSEAHTSLDPAPAKDYAGDISPSLAFQWWSQGQALLVDIRSNAERAWVGFVPDAPGIEWKIWPSMDVNPNFEDQLKAAAPMGGKVLMLCRSGVRSIPAAQRAQALGFQAYNVLEGFEGDPNDHAHRGTKNGWKVRGLPWRQN